MRRFVLLLVVLWAGGARAGDSPCVAAIAAAERARGTPPGLLLAIGLVESGRRDARTGVRAPWPWTVNAEGAGTFYATKADAVRAVQGLQARGVALIDVGCMQVNLVHHRQAFPTLEEAFDPGANALYAARFLTGLHARLRDWLTAAAAYHSLSPERGPQYGRLVAAVWSGAPVPTTVRADGAEVVRFADGGELRIMRDAGGGAGRVLGYLSAP